MDETRWRPGGSCGHGRLAGVMEAWTWQQRNTKKSRPWIIFFVISSHSTHSWESERVKHLPRPTCSCLGSTHMPHGGEARQVHWRATGQGRREGMALLEPLRTCYTCLSHPPTWPPPNNHTNPKLPPPDSNYARHPISVALGSDVTGPSPSPSSLAHTGGAGGRQPLVWKVIGRGSQRERV